MGKLLAVESEKLNDDNKIILNKKTKKPRERPLEAAIIFTHHTVRKCKHHSDDSAFSRASVVITCHVCPEGGARGKVIKIKRVHLHNNH